LLTWSSDSQFFASGGGDSQVVIWEAKTGKIYRKLTAKPNTIITKITFSPDGGKLLGISKTGGKLLGISKTNSIFIWDIEKSELNQVVEKQIDYSYSPDGQLLATIDLEDQITLWKISLESTEKKYITVGYISENKINNLTGGMRTKSEKSLKESSRSTAIKLLDSEILSNRTNKIVQLPSSNLEKNHNITNEQPRKDITNEQPRKDKRNGITSLAIDPTGTRIVSASDDSKIRLLDLKSGKSSLTISGHTGAVTGIAFSVDGKRLISASRDSEVRAWDATTGKLNQRFLAHEQPIRTVAVSSDGRFLASGGEETRIMIWDANLSKLVKIFNGHSDFITLMVILISLIVLLLVMMENY